MELSSKRQGEMVLILNTGRAEGMEALAESWGEQGNWRNTSLKVNPQATETSAKDRHNRKI